MSTAIAPVLSCEQLYDRLHIRYDGNAFAVFPEVRNSTGYAASRSADAIIMALWPSAGFRITGVEIKATRSDWLRELKNPKKAQEMMKFCDEWLILANHDVVDLAVDAFPEQWGLILPNGAGIKLVKDPQVNADRQPMPRAFVAALLRRASEFALSKKQTKAIREEAAREAESSMRRKLERIEEDHSRLKQQLKDFEETSGVYIGSSSYGKELGEAVKAYRSRNRWDDPEHQLRQILGIAQEVVATLSPQLAALEKPVELSA
jgi:hypothetical protein